MSFLKITDPSKRDHIVEQFLQSKKNITQNFLSERLGDIGLQRELTKLYKPITDIGKSQLTQQQAMSEAMTAKTFLPAIEFPQYPSIQAKTDDEEEKARLIQLGPIATQYLRSMASKTSTDKTFGLRDEDGKFYIGDSEVTISDDDIIIGDDTFKGTPGLWELITSKNPDGEIITIGDRENYTKILLKTNAIINPITGTVKSSKGEKYNKIIRPIYEEYLKPVQPRIKQSTPQSPALRRVPATATLLPPRTGRGVVFLPRDPNSLAEMLPVRLASFKAGNTGVADEIVAICDELLRQGEVGKEWYKNIMTQVNRGK